MNVDKLAHGLEKKGVIDAATANKLVKYCKGLGFSDYLIAFGIGAGIIGILIVVSANWYQIPYSFKLSIHTLVNGVLASVLFWMTQSGRQKAGWYQPLVGLLAVLTLTFIMLVNDVFRTHWSIGKIVTIWLLLVIPLWLGLSRNQQTTRKKLFSYLVTALDSLIKSLCALADKRLGKHVEKYLCRKMGSFSIVEKWPEEKISKKARPVLLALVLALPVLGVLSMAAGKQVFMPVRTLERFPIVSYDPRNPIKGDYLRFQFDGTSAPDKKAHDFFISKGKAEIDKLLSHPGEHSIKMEVQVLENKVLSVDMLYIDNMPWQEYLEFDKEQCRIRMGGEC